MDHSHKAASTPSMPAPSSQVESTMKRNKSSRACKECRRKKIKCNGENPCDRCQRAGQTCVFDAIFTSKRPTQHNSRLSPPSSIISTKVDKENQCYKASFLSHEYQLGDDSAISVNAAGRPFYFPDWTRQPNAPITTATNWDTTLINLYFDSIHPLFPIFHRATFHVQLQQGNIPKLLLNAIYAVAYLCYQSTELQQHLTTMGFTCYESAFSLLDESLDMPRLSTVQALLLMVKFQEHARPPGYQFRIQLLIDMAYRTCQSLNLSHRWHQDPVHAEVGIRVFGAVYAYMILFSIEQGTPPPLHDIDLPILLPDEHQQQPIDAEAITSFFTQCQIIQLQGKIASFLRVKYGKESNEEMTLNEESKLHKHLTECLDRIQQRHSNNIHTTAKSNIHEKASMLMAHNVRWLQISLHFTTILLHRPYATSDLKVREKCVVAASTLCQLVDDLIKSTSNEAVTLFGIPRGLQQLIHCMAASVTIHRLVQSCEGKKKRGNSNKSSKQVDKALDVIHTLLKSHNKNIALDDQAPKISQQHSHYRYSAPSMMQHYSTTLTSGHQQQQQPCTFDAVNGLPPTTTQWLSSKKSSKIDTSTMQQYDEMLLAAPSDVSTLGDHDDDPMSIDKQQHSILDFT